MERSSFNFQTLCFMRCMHSLLRRSVTKFENKNYEAVSFLYFHVESFDGDRYICKTFKKQLKKKAIACQTVFTKLNITSLPEELSNIRQLE